MPSDTGTTAPSEEKRDQQRALLTGLMRELMQSEWSAVRHPRREASHFGAAPPAQALRAVADHAEKNIGELRAVARRHDLPIGRVAVAVGAAMSALRHTIVDRMIERERSYRATLLGMRHGIDLVKLIRRIADDGGMVELAGFCTHWLEAREPLVERVESAMSWFASHPHRAAEVPRRRRWRPWRRAAAAS